MFFLGHSWNHTQGYQREDRDHRVTGNGSFNPSKQIGCLDFVRRLDFAEEFGLLQCAEETLCVLGLA